MASHLEKDPFVSLSSTTFSLTKQYSKQNPHNKINPHSFLSARLVSNQANNICWKSKMNNKGNKRVPFPTPLFSSDFLHKHETLLSILQETIVLAREIKTTFTCLCDLGGQQNSSSVLVINCSKQFWMVRLSAVECCCLRPLPLPC